VGRGQPSTTSALQRSLGRGRVISGMTARDLLLADGIPPDVEFMGPATDSFDYIHRRDGDTDIYFLANRSNSAASVACRFRVAGRAPELWNAVTGEHERAEAYEMLDGRTTVPLNFAPCASWIVVFREPAVTSEATAATNEPEFKPIRELDGSWTVRFDPEWGGPDEVEFSSLVSWTTRREPGIRFYSGSAMYVKTFDLPESAFRRANAGGSALFLDLGDVRELAEVRVNGQFCGVAWTPPFRVDISSAVRPGVNQLEVSVVNFWPNRIIGDAALPEDQRRTRTNIRQLKADTTLMESGLFGPVRIVERLSGGTGRWAANP